MTLRKSVCRQTWISIYSAACWWGMRSEIYYKSPTILCNLQTQCYTIYHWFTSYIVKYSLKNIRTVKRHFFFSVVVSS